MAEIGKKPYVKEMSKTRYKRKWVMSPKKVGGVAKNWELSYLELSLFGVVAKNVGVVALELSLGSCRTWSCLFWSCR